jgi:phage baseplate assembly protein W
MRNTRQFIDLDLNFIAHPVSGDITRKYDEYAIKQSVKNLIFTNHYERPFHPEIGSQITGLLFENWTPMLQSVLRQTIINTITNFEPRVKLIDVIVYPKPDENSIDVSITFKIVNTETPVTLDITLNRTR